MKKQLVSTRTRFIILNQTAKDSQKHWIYCELNINYQQVLANPDTKTPRIIERIRKRFNTNELVYKSDWSVKRGEPRSGKSIALLKFENQINNKLDKILSYQEIKNVDAIDKELIAVLEDFVRDENTKKKNNTISILKYVEDYINYRKEKNTPRGTLKEFTTVKNRLTAFIEEQDQDFGLEDVNLLFSDNLIKFMSKKEYHPNTIKKTFEIFVTVLNYYYNRREELQLSMNDKFKNPEFGKVIEVKSKPIALNDQEIDYIETVDLKGYKKKRIAQLERDLKKGIHPEFKRKFLMNNIEVLFKNHELTRKRILLQLSTGLRIGDLFKIRSTHKKGEVLVMKPKKTLGTKEDNTIYIPLNRISKKILEPIHYDSSRLKIPDHRYNEGIKEFLKEIELDEELEHYDYKGTKNPVISYKPKHELLTSHNLRDTFISKCIREKVPIPMILRATGQSSYEVMKKYIDLDNETMIENMKDIF